jgi:hypothetical protein
MGVVSPHFDIWLVNVGWLAHVLPAKPCHAYFSLKAVATAARPWRSFMRQLGRVAQLYAGFAFFTVDLGKEQG